MLCCAALADNGTNMLHRFGSGLQYNTWTLDAVPTITVRACSGGSSEGRECAVVVPPLAAALVEASALEKEAATTVTTTVTVAVTARHSGAFVRSSIPILLFAVPPLALAGVGGRPLRTLVGFERVEAAAGEAVRVSVEVPLRKMLLLAGADGEWGTERGQWSIEVESGHMAELGGTRSAMIEVA